MKIRTSTIVITIIFLWAWHCEGYNPWALASFYFFMLIRWACNEAREQVIRNDLKKLQSSWQKNSDKAKPKQIQMNHRIIKRYGEEYRNGMTCSELLERLKEEDRS